MEKDGSNFSNVKRILENNLNNLNEYVRYQEEKNKKLKNELKELSKCVDEDKKVCDAALNYVKMHSISSSDSGMNNEQILGMMNEMYSKMRILHLQLCNSTQKFAKTYFSQCDEGHPNKVSKSTSQTPKKCSSASQAGPSVSNVEVEMHAEEKDAASEDDCTKKKYLIDILKELLYDLNPKSNRTHYGSMIIDDTVCPHVVEYLISAGIVKQSATIPPHIELVDI